MAAGTMVPLTAAPAAFFGTWRGGLGLQITFPVTVTNTIFVTPPSPVPQPFAPSVRPLALGETDYGDDVSTFPFPDTTFSTLRGKRVLAEALSRRLLTRKGLIKLFPDYGEDVRDLVNETMSDARLEQTRARVEAELLQDERVDSLTVSVSFSLAASTLAISCSGTSSLGPFDFVLSVSSVSVELYLGA